jgi:flagellar biogenesis protein FliO
VKHDRAVNIAAGVVSFVALVVALAFIAVGSWAVVTLVNWIASH